MTTNNIIGIIFLTPILLFFIGAFTAVAIESIKYNKCLKKEPYKSYIKLYKKHSKYSQELTDLWFGIDKIKNKIDSLFKERVYLTPHNLYEINKQIVYLKFKLEQLTENYNIKGKLYSKLVTEEFIEFISALNKKQLKKLYWFMERYGHGYYTYITFVGEDKLEKIFEGYYKRRNDC